MPPMLISAFFFEYLTTGSWDNRVDYQALLLCLEVCHHIQLISLMCHFPHCYWTLHLSYTLCSYWSFKIYLFCESVCSLFGLEDPVDLLESSLFRFDFRFSFRVRCRSLGGSLGFKCGGQPFEGAFGCLTSENLGQVGSFWFIGHLCKLTSFFCFRLI